MIVRLFKALGWRPSWERLEHDPVLRVKADDDCITITPTLKPLTKPAALGGIAWRLGYWGFKIGNRRERRLSTREARDLRYLIPSHDRATMVDYAVPLRIEREEQTHALGYDLLVDALGLTERQMTMPELEAMIRTAILTALPPEKASALAAALK
jgi:hypothetical protein